MITFKFILRYLSILYLKIMNRKLNLFENLNDSISESISNEDSVNTIFQSDTRDLFNMQVSIFFLNYLKG